jgi:hypothetical protein
MYAAFEKIIIHVSVGLSCIVFHYLYQNIDGINDAGKVTQDCQQKAYPELHLRKKTKKPSFRNIIFSTGSNMLSISERYGPRR